MSKIKAQIAELHAMVKSLTELALQHGLQVQPAVDFLAKNGVTLKHIKFSFGAWRGYVDFKPVKRFEDSVTHSAHEQAIAWHEGRELVVKLKVEKTELCHLVTRLDDGAKFGLLILSDGKCLIETVDGEKTISGNFHSALRAIENRLYKILL